VSFGAQKWKNDREMMPIQPIRVLSGAILFQHRDVVDVMDLCLTLNDIALAGSKSMLR